MLSTSLFLAQQQQQGPNILLMVVPMLLMMYFMIIRPQRRQQKEHAAKLAALKSGDRIISAGGIYGTVTNIKKDSVIIKIAENVRVELQKSSVSVVVKKSDEPETPEVVESA